MKALLRVSFPTALLVCINGCATTSVEPVSEKLDPDTATTVTVLTRPIELYSETVRGPASDPFAYIAPFETDKMGERTLFLWVSAPQNSGPLTQPQILCNGEPLNLQPVSVPADKADGPPSSSATASIDLSQLSLSRAPYSSPVPWSKEWYFKLPPEGLKCMADATGIALEARQTGGNPERFSADRKNIASLDAFTKRY